MDLETVLKTYFAKISAQMIFSGQRDGALRALIEGILTRTRSPLITESESLAECAGMYPIALIEFTDPFEHDRESQELAKSLLAGELGAHAYQMYFLNEYAQQQLMIALTAFNRRRRATPFFFGGARQGYVSNCFAGECLYSLIIAREPLPKTIAAA